MAQKYRVVASEPDPYTVIDGPPQSSDPWAIVKVEPITPTAPDAQPGIDYDKLFEEVSGEGRGPGASTIAEQLAAKETARAKEARRQGNEEWGAYLAQAIRNIPRDAVEQAGGIVNLLGTAIGAAAELGSDIGNTARDAVGLTPYYLKERPNEDALKALPGAMLEHYGKYVDPETRALQVREHPVGLFLDVLPVKGAGAARAAAATAGRSAAASRAGQAAASAATRVKDAATTARSSPGAAVAGDLVELIPGYGDVMRGTRTARNIYNLYKAVRDARAAKAGPPPPAAGAPPPPPPAPPPVAPVQTVADLVEARPAARIAPPVVPAAPSAVRPWPPLRAVEAAPAAAGPVPPPPGAAEFAGRLPEGATLTRPWAERTRGQQSPAWVASDIGLAARRAGVTLTPGQRAAAGELVTTGGQTPVQAVRAVAEAPTKPRLTLDEARELARLLARGTPRAEADAAIQAQRALSSMTPSEMRAAIASRRVNRAPTAD